MQPYRRDIGNRNARVAGRDPETVLDLLEADIRPLFRKGGVLAQPLDEELLVPVD